MKASFQSIIAFQPIPDYGFVHTFGIAAYF